MQLIVHLRQKSAISSSHTTYSRPLTTNSSKPPAVPHTPPKSNSSSSKRHNSTCGAQRYKDKPIQSAKLCPWAVHHSHSTMHIPRIYPRNQVGLARKTNKNLRDEWICRYTAPQRLIILNLNLSKIRLKLHISRLAAQNRRILPSGNTG